MAPGWRRGSRRRGEEGSGSVDRKMLGAREELHDGVLFYLKWTRCPRGLSTGLIAGDGAAGPWLSGEVDW